MKKTIFLIAVAMLLPVIFACSQNIGPFAFLAGKPEIISSDSQSMEAATVKEVQQSPVSEQAASPQASKKTNATDETTGAAGALADDSLTLEKMLAYAIQDEYATRSEYEEVMNVLGTVNPFSNIIQSEETHISLLTPLFENYGYKIPEDDSAGTAVSPATLEEAKSIGAGAEINNIAMYEKFLQEDLPDDVRAVFEDLKKASESHLSAFQSAAGGGTGSGSGNGKGNGAGRD